jgi:hypothetical protein
MRPVPINILHKPLNLQVSVSACIVNNKYLYLIIMRLPNRKPARFFILTVTITILLATCATQRMVYYPDAAAPGNTPLLFAQKVISLPGRFEQNITFSANGREYYYGTTDKEDWWYRSILRTRVLKNGTIVTDTPDIIKNFAFVKDRFIGEPFLSPDGSELFFVAGFQPDIWMSKRKRDGNWNTPALLDGPVNTKAGEWNPSLSKQGTLYFASTRTDSGRLYKAARVQGSYPKVEMLKGPINADDAGDPCIAADESFIVFSSWKKGGFGGTDLYVSALQKDGTWSMPVNLGAGINTAEEEVGPRISPDGKYLFFHRRDKWQHATASDIYWVNMAVVSKHLKP